MKLLIIGSDTKLFEEGSAVRTRTLRSVDMYDSYVVAVVSRSARYYHQKNIGAKKNTSFYSVYSPYRVLLFFKALFFLWKVSKDVDVISSQNPTTHGLIALFVSVMRGKRLHIQIHSDFHPSVITCFVVRYAHRIRVVSEVVEQAVAPFARCPVDVLPVYIDKTRYQMAEADESIRACIPDTQFLVLSMSRLESEKKIDAVIQCAAVIEKKCRGVSFVIVGEGSQKDRLEQYAKKLGVTRIAFMPWTLTPERYYKAADLFITLSPSEGYGMTIVESLLGGTPVLTTNVGVASQYIIHGKNSWIVEKPGSAAVLLERIVTHTEQYNETKKQLQTTDFSAILDFPKHMKAMHDSYAAALENTPICR